MCGPLCPAALSGAPRAMMCYSALDSNHSGQSTWDVLACSCTRHPASPVAANLVRASEQHGRDEARCGCTIHAPGRGWRHDGVRVARVRDRARLRLQRRAHSSGLRGTLRRRVGERVLVVRYRQGLCVRLSGTGTRMRGRVRVDGWRWRGAAAHEEGYGGDRYACQRGSSYTTDNGRRWRLALRLSWHLRLRRRTGTV